MNNISLYKDLMILFGLGLWIAYTLFDFITAIIDIRKEREYESIFEDDDKSPLEELNVAINKFCISIGCENCSLWNKKHHECCPINEVRKQLTRLSIKEIERMNKIMEKNNEQD